jgi:hypothetical protein
LDWARDPPEEKNHPLPHKLWQGVIVLVGTYDICLGSTVVGQATVEKQGLYYRIACRCKIAGDTMRRIHVICGGKQENLGVCVPLESFFGLEKKIPCKRLGSGVPEFFLTPRDPGTQGKFVPVYPEEPFAYIRRLKECYLVRMNGRCYGAFK